MKSHHLACMSLAQVLMMVIALSVLSTAQRERLGEIKGEMFKTLEQCRLAEQRYTYIAAELEKLSAIKIQQETIRGAIHQLEDKVNGMSPVINITNRLPNPDEGLLMPMPSGLADLEAHAQPAPLPEPKLPTKKK